MFSGPTIKNAHNDRLTQVHHSLKQGHFKNICVETKKARVGAEGSTFKKPSAAQSKIQTQTLAAAVSGLIPCGKLAKARNMLDLEEELLFRGTPTAKLPPQITARKEMLKNLEVERLASEGVREEDAAKLKTFKKLSNAPFKLTDDRT